MDISNGFIALTESIHILYSIVEYNDDLRLSDYELRNRKKVEEEKLLANHKFAFENFQITWNLSDIIIVLFIYYFLNLP